jgi:hypothetical protein
MSSKIAALDMEGNVLEPDVPLRLKLRVLHVVPVQVDAAATIVCLTMPLLSSLRFSRDLSAANTDSSGKPRVQLC